MNDQIVMPYSTETSESMGSDTYATRIGIGTGLIESAKLAMEPAAARLGDPPDLRRALNELYQLLFDEEIASDVTANMLLDAMDNADEAG